MTVVHSVRRLRLMGRLRQDRHPRTVKPRIWRNLFTGMCFWCSYTKANLNCFGPRRTSLHLFVISLSSRSKRFSLRSRSFSFARSISAASGKSPGRAFYIHFASVEKPTPRSDATWRRFSPLVSAIRTTSRLNYSVCMRPIITLLYAW